MLLGVIFTPLAGHAQGVIYDAAGRPANRHPSVVPNQILIKLKDATLDRISKAGGSGAAKVTEQLPTSLRALNTALGARRVEAVFPSSLDAQAASASASSATQKLNPRPARLARAPRGATPPRLGGILRISLNPQSPIPQEQALHAYRADPAVEFAEPNYLLSTSAATTPNDPLYPKQWALNNTGQDYPSSRRFTLPPGTPDADLDAPEAWSTTAGTSATVVAVIDTGIDFHHRDLIANLWTNPAEKKGKPGVDDDKNGFADDVYGYNFVNNTANPTDDNGHGTHVAGLIAATGNNGLDITGVSWRSRLMALKYAGADGEGSTDNAARAMTYATAMGADVINCSWGSYAPSQTLQSAIQYAISQGVVVVAAAGNEGFNAVFYPAAYPGVIAVGATDSRDARADFSNYGCYVSLAAPGVDLLSLRADGTSLGTVQDAYTTVASGTSMACPLAAGVAALVLGRRPTLTSDQLCSLLKLTADPLKTAHYLGQGRLNAQRAVAESGTPPLCRLDMQAYLAQNGKIGGKFDITGTAGGGDFTSYTLYCGAGEEPAAWTRLVTSTRAVTSGTLLAQFNTVALADGLYTIRLEAGEKKGRKVSDRRYIYVSNVTQTSPYSNDILRPGGVLDVKLSGAEAFVPDAIEWGLGAQPAAWSSQGITLQDGTAGLLGRWNTAFITSNNFYTLRIRCHSASGSREVYIRSIYFDTSLKPGWPQYVPRSHDDDGQYWPETFVTNADLDGDGHEELVCVESADLNGKPAVLRVYRDDGTLAWTRNLDVFVSTPDNWSHPHNSMPVIGDMDGDGQKEIVVDVGSSLFNIVTGGSDFAVYCFRADGSRMQGNWPIKLKGGIMGTKLLADVNHDGRLELAFRTSNNLYVVDYTGKILSQRSSMRYGSIWLSEQRTISVGKFDDTGNLGIVDTWGRDAQTSATYANEDVVILRPDGSLMPGWPMNLYSTLVRNMVTADFDNDGYDEVAFAAAPNEVTGKGGGVYVVDRFGKTLPGWPVLTDLSLDDAQKIAFSAGDINGDGRPEVVVSLNNAMGIYDWHGQLVNGGFSIRVRSLSSFMQPMIGDLNRDRKSDIALIDGALGPLAVNNGDFSDSGGVAACDGTYTPIDLSVDPHSDHLWMEGVGMFENLTLADIDHDGKLDLIAVSNQDTTWDDMRLSKWRDTIYVWSLNVPYRADTMQWPTFQHDPQRTGRLYTPPNTARRGWRLYK